MEKIQTIDLWTEQHANHYDCFNGAFSDGFENKKKGVSLMTDIRL